MLEHVSVRKGNQLSASCEYHGAQAIIGMFFQDGLTGSWG